jgi:hypothetical protein
VGPVTSLPLVGLAPEARSGSGGTLLKVDGGDVVAGGSKLEAPVSSAARARR